MPLDPKLVALLACPKCHGTLEPSENPPAFVCRVCALRFRTNDDVPNFLLEEAQPITGDGNRSEVA